MRRCLAMLAALALSAAFLGQATAVELKNPRSTYGPLGAVRSNTKFLPGDYLFMTYDIDGLQIDAKSGKCNYKTVLELFDSQNKVIFKKETPNEVVPQLGGSRLPGDLHVIMGRSQAPGKYNVRLTVIDNLGKDGKSFLYPFEIVPPTFGLVGVTAPAVGFPGQPYSAQFAMVNLTLDGKKMPSVDITMRILDESGTKQVAAPVFSNLPRDLPEEINLQKENFVPMQFPIYLNRAGRFTIDIEAVDKNANKKASLRYSLTVLDLGSVLGN